MATHAHHWLIESPAPGKPVLHGICQLCGQARQFTASMTEFDNNSMGRQAIAERSLAWKTQATIMLESGHDVAGVAAELGWSISAVQRLKRRPTLSGLPAPEPSFGI